MAAAVTEEGGSYVCLSTTTTRWSSDSTKWTMASWNVRSWSTDADPQMMEDNRFETR